MIDLSIIVPLYNTEKYIARCLDSLLNQSIPVDRYEILVINDGSPDNGKQLVEKYVSKYSNIKLFDQTNQGLYITRNRGIEIASGKYLYFIDSDDFIAENSLFSIIEYMKEYELDIFGFSIVATSESSLAPMNISKSDLIELEIFDGPTYISQKSFRNEVVWYLVNREFLIKNNMSFRNGHGLEDGIFTAELIYNAKRITSALLKIYGYFQRPESTMHTNNSLRNRHLLKGYEVSAIEFNNFYEHAKKEQKLNDSGLERIKCKQQSYVFFLLIRVVKSDLTFTEINDLLNRLKKLNFYPIRGFPGKDYNGFIYRLLVVILNHRLLLFPATYSFRMLKRIMNLFTKTA